MKEDNVIPPVELADTGMWRLVMMFGDTHAEAWLKNTIDVTIPPVNLFRKSWEITSEENPMARIRNIVFENPRVLDDFSADIIIRSDKTIWIPRDAVKEIDDEQRYYGEIFPSLETETLIDEVDDKLCLYALCDGMTPYLQRTFAGARVLSHQSVLYNKFSERSDNKPTVYADINSYGTDIMGFNEGRLLFSITLSTNNDGDIIYYLFNAINAYNLPVEDTHIFLSGDKDIRRKITEAIRGHVGFVMPTMLPRVGMPASMSLPVLYCLTRRDKKE